MEEWVFGKEKISLDALNGKKQFSCKRGISAAYTHKL